MRLYEIIIAILYTASIISMLIFIIWKFEYLNLIGFVFLFLASLNLLIKEILVKKRKSV